MCGRATLSTRPADLAEVFGLDEVALLTPHYNVARGHGGHPDCQKIIERVPRPRFSFERKRVAEV
jgi:hypothetical protein